MISKWQWLWLQLTRKLWVRASLLAVLGVLTALAATISERFIPWDLPTKVGADAVDNILNILATSMLAVTTFSLNVMVSAYSSATNNVTPRATKLLMQDSTTQNVLAVFIGSFLFSLVGIITLSMEAYGDKGRVVLFVVTIGVTILIVVTILRWIDHLSRLGRVGATTDRVEHATATALQSRAKTPYLGGRALLDPASEVPSSALAIYPHTTGYVQHIDIATLSACAEEEGGRILVAVLPGAFVYPHRPLAWVDGDANGRLAAATREAFTLAGERTYDQDPRFGLVVLAEIASRALSPAINDAGTAIDVIGRSVRLLATWQESVEPAPVKEAKFSRVWVPPLRLEDLMDDVYQSIIRDGAATFEVQVRIQKALLALAQTGDGRFMTNAARLARRALNRVEATAMLEEEKVEIRRLATQIQTLANAT